MRKPTTTKPKSATRNAKQPRELSAAELAKTSGGYTDDGVTLAATGFGDI